MYYLILCTSWCMYYLLHSYLASYPAKAWMSSFMGQQYKWYRIFYNLVSVLGLIGLWMVSSPKEKVILFEYRGIHCISGLLFVTGCFLMYRSFKNYDSKEFLGIRQLHADSPQQMKQTLKTSGFNRYVRHPLYFSSIIVLIAYVLFSRTLTSVIITSISIIYLWIGALQEEKKLIAAFGDQYLQYKKSVKMLIPHVL